MSAVPQQLLSLPKVKGLKGIDTRIHRIYPTNASGATEFVPEGGLSRIIFSIPAYKSGFYNPQRSFFHFKAKTDAATTHFNPGLPVINRMVLRTGNGMVIEDIQDYSVIQRILSNFEDESVKRGRGALTGDLRANIATVNLATIGAAHAAGKTFTHDLLSGVLGKRQQHYIPVGLFNASGGFSFELELHLEKANVACSSSDSSATSVNYSLSDVSLQMEVVTLPTTVTDRLNSELQSDNKVQIPFSSFRLHQAHFPSGSTAVDVNISEHAHDLETIHTVLRDQTTLVKNITDYGNDNLVFEGGGGQTNKLKSYQWRYDTKYYPDAKAEMAANDASLALCNAVHTLDVADKPVFAALDNVWDYAGVCCIVQSFKSSRDDFMNSLNSSSTGAPVELQIALKAAVVNALRIDSFCKSNYTLNIMRGGQTTIQRVCKRIKEN